MPKLPPELTIGQAAERSGLTVSQIRFYEGRGLIDPPRNRGGQRRFPRAELRRLALIRTASRMGIPLRCLKAAFAAIPAGQTPRPEHWRAVAAGMAADLDARIETLTRLRANLDGCIGCGCLSMESCALSNPDDTMATEGKGAAHVDRGLHPEDAAR